MDSTFLDFGLLKFATYEEYLDSYVTPEDLRYLRSVKYARLIAKLGYNSTSEMLSQDDFEARRKFAKELLNPSKKPHEMYSQHHIDDPVINELAARERANRVGILSTIIFLRHTAKTGFEVSGYIDFEWSLRRCRSKEEGSIDWEAVFKGKKHLWPTVRDLGYFNWKTGVSYSNDTTNYKIIADPTIGLLFRNMHDRKNINPDPRLRVPGENTTRIVVTGSNRYEQCVLFDHVSRKLI